MTRPKRQAVGYLNGDVVEVAPKASLPQTSFVSIEYPAILTRKPYPSDERQEHPSLVKALESLSPLPAGYTSAASALLHIGKLVSQDHKRVIECKLAQACDPSAGTRQAPPVHPRTTNAIFRHALLGDIVDTHNIVCRIRKRTWTRTRNGGVETCKEYTAEALGMTRHVARFRTMPDYAYDPGSMVDPRRRDEQEVAPSIALHDALRQMDIEGIRTFRLEEESEDYEVDVPGRGKMSNVRMPPPALFAKTDSAQSYGFRQNPTSYLTPVGEPDADGRRPMRFVNRQKHRDLAPIPFSIHSGSSKRKAVPNEPLEFVKNHHVNAPDLLERLKNIAVERPMWSRRALFNQFKGEDRRALQNQRHIISSVFYTITDGCWRDNLVRFGYDPRKDQDARFYQRVAFQRQTRANVQGQPEAQHEQSPENQRSESPIQEQVAPAEEDE